MHTLTSYLLSANLLLALGYFVYYWLYRKEGNLQFNRAFLMGIALLAWLIPIFPWSTLVSNAPTISGTPPIAEVFTFSLSEEHPMTPISSSVNEAAAVKHIDWTAFFLYAIGIIYLAVSTTLLFRFLISLGSLFRLVRQFPREQHSDHVLLHANQEIGPFSFFKLIILNPQLYQQEQYQLIYQHELVHARQWHNLDLLIAELWCIVCWFNPLTWKMKNQIRQNLEFIADDAVLKMGANRKVYQYCLLRLNVASNLQYKFASHFNQSLLKKRIVMMNRKKSPDTFSLKHLFLLPLLAIMVLVSVPLQSQKVTKNTTQYGATSVTDYPANSVTDHPGDQDLLSEIPILDGESVYGIIRAGSTMENLDLMKREFAKRGIKIEASNINFTSKGKLASIEIKLTQWNQSTITQKIGNGKQAIKGFLCLFFKHNKSEKSAIIGLEKNLFPNFVELETSQVRSLKTLTGTAIISLTDRGSDTVLIGKTVLGRGKDF